jgi:hypothetical protein
MTNKEISESGGLKWGDVSVLLGAELMKLLLAREVDVVLFNHLAMDS